MAARCRMLFTAIAMTTLLATESAVAARWEIFGAAPEVAIETSTVGPSLRLPGATGVWLTYRPSMSVDCSPPRGCYAKAQRIYYVFNCSPRWAMPVERFSFDLNGNIVNQEVRTDGDAYSADADVGALVIMETYCPRYGYRDRR